MKKNKKLKIAIIFKPYRPLKIPFSGGMMNYVYFLSKGLSGKGHKVTVFADKNAKVAKGVEVIRTRYKIQDLDVYHAGQKFYNKINKIKRENCRKHVEKNFNIQRMVDGYEKIYRKIIKNAWQKEYEK